MFVELMNDIHSTFTERFLRAQIVFNPPGAPPASAGTPGAGGDGGRRGDGRRAPSRRYNALGVMEDVPPDEEEASSAVDIGPGESPAGAPVARAEPTVVGAGRVKSLSTPRGAAAPADWASVGRNDPCPCGSGRKFKKCHGASL